MAPYLEIDITLISRQEEEQEYVLALLADFGFDGFREEEGRIIGYMPAETFRSEAFESFLIRHGLKEKIKRFKTLTIPVRNWNSIWEKGYSPVQIGKKCVIRAPFHHPRKDIKHDLVISPKMSFGTAHHETTRMMLESILEREWSGQEVLDFGCGTGVLAILTEKMGARNILALDNDPWAYSNALENIALNNCRNISITQGEIGILEEHSFDAILGNINLNVLLKEMHNLSARLRKEGIAILSGFYEKDLQTLNESAGKNKLSLLENQSMNNWSVAVYRKGD